MGVVVLVVEAILVFVVGVLVVEAAVGLVVRVVVVVLDPLDLLA